ncbi:MAG: NAD(P)-dependent oxidoreductase [Planctomycetes bacterium]|nr:NAD(P)-dependent oxidoreductase [Planctomycetota bacterium]
MRILVTGAGGFLGGAVVRVALARGHDVTALLRGEPRAEPRAELAPARVVHGDLAQSTELEALVGGHDAVIHCAASMRNDPTKQQRDTIDATCALVAALERAGVGRLVLASSLAVYDHLLCGERLDESAPLERDLAVRGPYVAAKLEVERLARDSRLDARILRPGLIHGEGREWFHHLGLALGGRVWIALCGSARLPLVSLESCAQAFVLAAEVRQGDFTANIVDERVTTRGEYLRALARAKRPRPLVVSLPWGLLSAASRLANLVGRGSGALQRARLAARCRPLDYPCELARRTLGWPLRAE